MVWRSLLAGLWMVCGAVVVQPAIALGQSQGAESSPILVIDSDRLYRDSAYGRQIEQELEAKGAALAAEFRKIEEALKAEELDLTQRRDSLTAAEFRPLADAFDQKVQKIRQEQAAKSRAFDEQRVAARDSFLGQVEPVVEQLMRENDAQILLERRSVIYRDPKIDVTSRVIERLDATLGQD